MPTGPRPADIPRVRKVLAVYRVSAIITGIFLLLLCLMMVFRYGFNVDIELNGPFGFLSLQPRALIEGVNLSTAVLIIHGWLYVLYLACDFLMWRMLRFSFGRFLVIALGGVIPLLSFFYEFRIPKFVEGELAKAEARQPAGVAA